MMLALFERLRRQAGRKLRPCARPDRGGQARVARPRPHHHRSRSPAAAARAFPHRCLPRRGSRRHRPPQGRTVAGVARAGRHHLDGRRRRLRSRRLLHPVALLGVRLRRGAAAHRRADAEPRHQLLARPPRVNALEPGRLPLHTLNPALAVLRDGRVMAYGTMGGEGPAADPGGAVHAPRSVPATARSGTRRARAGSSAGPGARRTAASSSKAASTAT